MTTVIVTLKRSFVNFAAEDGVTLPAPVKTTKAADTFEFDRAAWDAAKEEADVLVAYEDHENKLAAANMRRAGERALKALEEAGRPAAKKAEKTKREIAAERAAKRRAKAKPAPKLADDEHKLHATLEEAFDFFNAKLFDGVLAPVMIVPHRKRNTHGYFWSDQWTNGDGSRSEIALNPETMARGAKEVLSTLVHEMVHHEQHLFGAPAKSGHNVEWMEWMERVGLEAYGVGTCEGKKSGPHFTHRIIDGGLFDVAADEFIAGKGEDAFKWGARRVLKPKKQDLSKVKHVCPCCDAKVWGKDGINVTCGDCEEPMVSTYYA